MPFGIRLYGLAAIWLGLIGIIWDDFAQVWQPVPGGLPGRALFAYLFAALLLVAGGATVWRRSSAILGTATLCGLYGVVVVLMHGVQIVKHPLEFAAWDVAAEQLALVSGGLAAYACVSRAETRRTALLTRISVATMGLCLMSFGLAHFLFLDFTADMVPKWLPGGQRFWAIATGVAHLAAGAAFLSGAQVRLAAVLLTVMFAAFGILIHAPLLLAEPAKHTSWVTNAINLALTGAVWAIAARLSQMRDPALQATLLRTVRSG